MNLKNIPGFQAASRPEMDLGFLFFIPDYERKKRALALVLRQPLL